MLKHVHGWFKKVFAPLPEVDPSIRAAYDAYARSIGEVERAWEERILRAERDYAKAEANLRRIILIEELKDTRYGY